MQHAMSCDEVVSVKGKGRRRCRGQFTNKIAINHDADLNRRSLSSVNDHSSWTEWHISSNLFERATIRRVTFIASAMSAQSGLLYATRRKIETSSQSVKRKRGIRVRSCLMTTLRSTARRMDAWRNTWKISRICVRVKVDFDDDSG